MADKTWPEVKALLDDPSVPEASKAMLLDSWQQQHPPLSWAQRIGMPKAAQEQFDARQAEVDKYADAYNAHGAPFGVATDVNTAYDVAKKSRDQAAYNEDQEKKAVDQGKQQLDGKQAPGPGGAGTQTSDELFDAAAPALKVFQTFGSLLAQIPPDCRGNTRPLDFQNDIQKRFDEQRGISFKNFLDDAGHFKNGSTTTDDTSTNTDSALTKLFHSWTGSGADSASNHYNKDIQPKARKLVQTLEDASEATTTAVNTIFQLCKGKADAVVKAYTNVVGKADFNMAQKVVNVANGTHASNDDLEQIAGWMDLNFGTNLQGALNDDGCCDGDDIKQQGEDLAKQWIQNSFNPDMWDRLYLGFDKTCKDTLDLVNQAYDALDEVMGKIKNEFEGQDQQGATQPSGSSGGTGPSAGTGPGSAGGGSALGPGMSSGGGPGGGSGGAPAPAPTMPSATPSATAPATDDPQKVAQEAKQEAGQGINPYTGKPMEMNPETGQPYPIDPKTGEAIKDDGERETLKVQQGDKTIEMDEPGKDGKMDIKVGEGQGAPKDYKLDWGDGKQGATPGDPAQAGAPGQQGAGDGKPGPDGTYTPGPDGKIHIQDGALKITAERPDGPGGPTVVTVDDGSGKPTTYTVGEEKDAAGAPGSGATPGTGAAAGTAGAGSAGGSGDTAGAGAAAGTAGAGGAVGTGETAGTGAGGAVGAGDAAGAGGAAVGQTGLASGDSAGQAGGAPVGAGAVGGDLGSGVSTMPTGADGVTTPDGGAGATVPAGELGPVGSGIASVSGDLGGGAAAGAPEGSMSGSLGATGSLEAGHQTGASTQQGQPSLGVPQGGAPDPAAAIQQQQQGSGGMGALGGMPMMGGGGAGGGGDDQERSSRQYRIEGGIFNSGGAGGRITGSLEDEGDRSVADRSARQ